jgi:hypothetical protein
MSAARCHIDACMDVGDAHKDHATYTTTRLFGSSHELVKYQIEMYSKFTFISPPAFWTA